MEGPQNCGGPRGIFLRPHGWVGIGGMVLSEILLFQGVPFVRTFFTPLVWSGYILLVDSVLADQTGFSIIFDRGKEFAVLLLLSIGLWLIFEYYNLFFQNWNYVGLPKETIPRYLGYAWAFSTIWPAILLTAAMIGQTGWVRRKKVPPFSVTPLGHMIFFLLGFICLTLPFFLPEPLAQYTAGPVWLGFIFLLEPMNYRRGRYSLLRDLERGDPRKLLSLVLAGLLCGLLWEFWNFWAGAKWHYTIPIWGQIKIFEMPVLGYFGFPPFAVECYVMVGFLWNLASPKGEAEILRLCRGVDPMDPVGIPDGALP